MNQSEQINELAKAMAQAQAILEPAPLDGYNPHFKSHFATLVSVRGAARVYAQYGVSYTNLHGYYIFPDGSHVWGQFFQVMHPSGQWMRSFVPLDERATDQQRGARNTYTERQTIKGGLAIPVADEDDDGEATRKSNGAAPVEKITNEQTAKICSAAEAKGVSAESVCSYYGIDKVSDLPASQYDGAMKKLGKGANATGK